MKWAMDETAANENASMDLIRFATWAKKEFKGRENVVLTLRPPKAQEDPEMRAKIAPPDLDVMTWESAGSSDSNRSRRQPSGIARGRRWTNALDAMDSEMSEELKLEIKEMETKLAILRQKGRAEAIVHSGAPCNNWSKQ